MRKINSIKYIICMSVILAFVLTGCGGKKKSGAVSTPTDANGNVVSIDQAQSIQQNIAGTTNAATPDDTGFFVTDDYVETVGETVNVRVEPSTDASIYMLLETGKVIRRTGYNDEWTRVNIDNTNFYVYSEFVAETDKLPEPEVDENTDNSGDDNQEEQRVPKEKTIVIDPANQMNMIASTETIGPGSEDSKVGVNTGAVGISQGTAEYALNLNYALALKEELEERGYTVTLTRETNDANISNKQRAELANATGATAFVRIKMNYSSNQELSGVMATTMRHNSPYNADLYDESQELATRILQGVIQMTGATNHGISETNGMTAINWSDIPVVVVELGYLSNATDEANLLDIDYQRKVVAGIADGIDLYYN